LFWALSHHIKTPKSLQTFVSTKRPTDHPKTEADPTAKMSC